MTSLLNHPAPDRVQPVHMPGNWLFGNARQFVDDPLGMMTKAAGMGRVVQMRFLTETAFMLREPDDIKWVLVDNHRNYLKGRGTQALRPILGEGLLTSEDDLHATHQRLVQPACHRRRIGAYADPIRPVGGARTAGSPRRPGYSTSRRVA